MAEFRAPFLLGCILACSGCGGATSDSGTSAAAPSPGASVSAEKGASPSDAASNAAAPAVAVAEVRKVPKEGLPIGDYLPPLDDGRIEIPIPTGWSPLPRDSKYLARFYKDDKNGLPRLEVLLDEQSLGVETVTTENVKSFATSVAQSLGDKKLLEPVLPMVLGDVPCARYVLKVELKMPQGSVVAERQTIVTVRAGRTYTVQLLVLPNTLIADRDAAYGLVAGLRFP